MQPLLQGSSIVEGNRCVFGTDSWVVQYPRAYTQLNNTGILLGNQPTRNVQYSGSITAGIIEANTLAIVGIRIYSEGGLNIMGDARVFGTAIASSSISPSVEQSKYDIASLQHKLCLDIVKSVDVNEYTQEDIDEQTSIGLFAQELQAALSEQLPHTANLVVQSGDMLSVDSGGLVCIMGCT